MTLKITEVVPSDMKEIEGLYRKLYIGDEKQDFYKSELSLSNFKSGQIILVAKEDTKIVGYCWIVWYKHIKEKAVGYLEELYVEDYVRNKGIGKDLINNAIDLLEKLDIKTIYTAVGKHMKDAQEFYRHIGFTESDEQWFEKKL